MNASHGILIGGGYPGSKETYIVNLKSFQMETGPELSIERSHSACSRFSHVNGTEYVIVAGGWYAGVSTEILNVRDNSGTWIAGILTWYSP